MPAFVAALLGGLINIAATLAGRVLLALGFSVVTFTGMSTSLDWLRDQALSAFTGLGAEVLGLLALMKVGESMSIVFSAILARQLINGLGSDSIKRLVQR